MSIQRPPVIESFDLPTHDELLEVKETTQHVWVKLIFSQDDKASERMWVKVNDTSDLHEWVGMLDNCPFELGNVALGDEIRFHPLDIIATMFATERGK